MTNKNEDLNIEQLEVKREKEIERELKKEEKSMKAILAAQKKVPIFIPEDPNNPDEVQIVGVNGVIYAIPRGEQYEVPESVYQVWKESFDKTRAVNNRIKITEKKELEVF